MTAINPPRPGQDGLGALQALPRLDAADAAARAAVDLARHLRRRGWRALVASAGGPLERELAAAGATHVRLPLDRDGWPALWANAARLARLARAHRVALCHAHAPGPAWSARRAARRAGAAFVTTCHAAAPDAEAGFLARRRRRALLAGGRVIAVSDHLGEALAAAGVDAARLRVVRGWVDPAELDPERVRGHRVAALAERCGIAAGLRLVVAPGPLDPGQGHLLLLDALALLPRRDFAVLLAGAAEPGDRRAAAILARARAAGIADRVRFAGAVADLPAFLALADVVVLPAVRPEPSGTLAAAAQAMGKPVIVTDQGALPEAVMPAATGWLVPSGDAGELARALDLALSLDEPVRRRLAERARAFVLDRYAVEPLCERTLDVYREALAAAAAGRRPLA